MSKVYSEALDQHLEVERHIGRIKGSEPGPCMIFFGGIHGNEPSGVFALNRVLEELKEQKVPVKGSIIALAGNLWALERSKRFDKEDLNRVWTHERVAALKDESFVPSNEDEKEQEEIFGIIKNLLETETGPFYFLDLHTTSSETIPFLTVNDSLLNRKFSQQYPAPVILGIEEYLDGPLLSYINELGYVSFGFESGQHDAIASVDNHVAFTYLSLVFSGAISAESINYDHYFESLGDLSGDFYEIYYRYAIEKDERFLMEPGFINFQKIIKNQLLAKNNGKPIKAAGNSTIFMPLYQAQGNDGFFQIRRVPAFFLRLSSLFRKLRFDRMLRFMPGVRRDPSMPGTLIVNQKIARFLAKQFLHILGYRNQTLDKTHLIIKNREMNARNEDYVHEEWYKERYITKPKQH
ncbi:MAG: aspartoacylase [Crocinitomix sp.]|nr:aspartoacylase [Crocinitomix sp.]